MDVYQMFSSIMIKFSMFKEGRKGLDKKYFVQGNSHLLEAHLNVFKAHL